MINQAIADRLRGRGVRRRPGVGRAGRGRAYSETAPDLVVLDVMLPGYDGHEVCRRIQAERPVPVLMVTARDDEADILVGLGVGADDYLTKPFRMRELVARIARLLRRVDRAAELARRRPLELRRPRRSTRAPARSGSARTRSGSPRPSSTCWSASPRHPGRC